jgi:hypothetical protein
MTFTDTFQTSSKKQSGIYNRTYATKTKNESFQTFSIPPTPLKRVALPESCVSYECKRNTRYKIFDTESVLKPLKSLYTQLEVQYYTQYKALLLSTFNTQHFQHSVLSTQHFQHSALSTLSTQHSALLTLSTLNTQHSALSTQHS